MDKIVKVFYETKPIVTLKIDIEKKDLEKVLSGLYEFLGIKRKYMRYQG